MDEAWPVVLLALRISVVLVLYLFLLSGFRALRSELRAPALQLSPPPPPRREAVDAPHAVAPATDDEVAPLPPRPTASPAPRHRERRQSAGRHIPRSLAIPAGVAALVLVVGGAAALGGRPSDTGAPAGATPAPASGAFGPPVVKPPSGRVTVGLAAQEDALVRVTVDGVVQFDGTLKAGQRQSWDGAQRIQVWTDKGKTVLIAINGVDLGPYSPAMGHPEWNRIDFGFTPGWTR